MYWFALYSDPASDYESGGDVVGELGGGGGCKGGGPG
jgi:hypothetical protein